MMDLKDIAKAWDLFSERSKDAEQVAAEFTPWLIGLDAAIVGVTISGLRNLQDQPLIFKLPIAIGLVLLMGSFFCGILFRKGRVEFKAGQADESRMQFQLAQATAMRSAAGGPPSKEIHEQAEDWHREVRAGTRREKQLARLGKWTFELFIVGLISLVSGFLALFFRPELHQLRNFLVRTLGL